jgi:monothiol glutaredoxin
MSLDDAMRKRLSDLIAVDEVVLFMKGHRNAPQCGFSAQTIEILDDYRPHFACFDVLADGALREAIKEFSDWPTIPQLYVKGEFVGGADIVAQMHRNGELEDLLGPKRARVSQPEIEITDAAAEQIRAALGDAGGDVLRLSVDYRYHNDLFVGPEEEDDIIAESNGLALHFDRASAARANGVKLDFVTDQRGTGFAIDNPNCPPQVEDISAAQVKAAMDADADLHVYDVRTPQEMATASVDGMRPFDEDAREELDTLDRSTPIYFMCHHGMRSRAAAEQYAGMGFRKVYNLRGGIDAWSNEVDPSVPRY